MLKIWRAEIAEASGAPGKILAADGSGVLVGCGYQGLRILQLQREGARRLAPQEFLAGCPLRAGDYLS